MKRGEIWSVAARSDYFGKPRPAVIVQGDDFAALESITICPFTSNKGSAPVFRPIVEAGAENGLTADSRLMADKITTLSKARLGRRIGRLSEREMLQLNRALMIFLGLVA